MAKVFIDGSAGTTGLRIHERLAQRTDLQVVTLPDELRKDAAARKEMLNAADIAFLCLPDAAAVEAVSLVESPNTVIIDTSTAHRVNPAWAYGFPEVGDKAAIAASARIANPGCHASGFIALVAPLVKAGVIAPDEQLSCFSLTGYSGGGKSMIAQYEDPAGRDALLEAPRVYGLSQTHKHLPEMAQVCGLSAAPIFVPTVAPYYAGMEVCVPLFASQAKGGKEAIEQAFSAAYAQGLVHYVAEDEAAEGGFLSAAAFTGRDDMQVTVTGNDDRILLVARFDNLGKGSSGAAIQNMNLVLGVPEATGLNV